jgi:hypothetical protein
LAQSRGFAQKWPKTQKSRDFGLISKAFLGLEGPIEAFIGQIHLSGEH